MEKETMVATVPQTEIVDEQQLTRDVTDIEFKAESLVIQSDADYATAGEFGKMLKKKASQVTTCLLYTSPSPRDATLSRMPSSA